MNTVERSLRYHKPAGLTDLHKDARMQLVASKDTTLHAMQVLSRPTQVNGPAQLSSYGLSTTHVTGANLHDNWGTSNRPLFGWVKSTQIHPASLRTSRIGDDIAEETLSDLRKVLLE